MTTPGKKVAVAFAAVLAFTLMAFGQDTDWNVVVNGSPIALPRPVVHSGGDLFVPLLPVARALGFEVELARDIEGLRVRRGAGAVIEYDGRSGEIRFGPVVAGQLRNYKQLTLTGPLDELLFPVDGLITLLAVDVQLDHAANALRIDSSGGLLNVPSAHRVGVSSLDYSLGVTKAGESDGYYSMFRSGARAGGIPLNSTFLLTGEDADVHLQQGTVMADLGRRRALIGGDHTTISGIDSLVSSVRGIGFSTPFKAFETHAYAGRTAGSVRALAGAPGVANYDSTIVGGAMRKRSFDGDLWFAANSFSGPERKGTSAGASFVKTTERHQMRGQMVVGGFSGLSQRTSTIAEMNAGLPFDPLAPAAQAAEKVRVQGAALGLSLFDTFKPVEPLTVTGQFERYGKNFLTPREDSQFNAQSTERVSMTLRPLKTLSLYGGMTHRRYLAGDPDSMHGFNYGAFGAVPTIPWMQLGYFRVVQTDTAFSSGRLEMSQYSATLVNVLQYSGSFMFTDMQFGNSPSRTIHAAVGRDFSSYGHFTVHDQIQFSNLHRYGAEWQLAIPQGSVRLGFDRLTYLQTAERSYVPVLGLAFKLPGEQRLLASYSGERGSHILSIVIGGPLLKREDVRKDDGGRVSVVAQASLAGHVFLDSDENNAFSSASDVAMSGITIWLDSETSAVTDATGAFRFDRVKSGSHSIRADLAEVPADMVFADSGERRVAVLPFRSNIQDFAVVRTGSLTGKVTYLDYSEDPEHPVRKPLPEARVIADDEHDTYSDLDGNITLGSLTPGIYQLKVDPSTAPEGYSAASDPQEVRVRAGEVLHGVQIQLSIPPRPVIIKELPSQKTVSAQ
jgi:hypothetical protein